MLFIDQYSAVSNQFFQLTVQYFYNCVSAI